MTRYRQSIYSTNYMLPTMFGSKTLDMSDDHNFIKYNGENFPLRFKTLVKYNTNFFNGVDFVKKVALDRIYFADDREFRVSYIMGDKAYILDHITFDNVVYKKE